MTTIYAQIAGARIDFDIYKENGDILNASNLGGLNNPQFSEIDLNRDGIMDLFIFDKTGNVPLTFINNGAANTVDYIFAPEYISIFPETLKEWVLLRDFNQDGIMDIFSYSSTQGIAGVDVYEGSYDVTNGWSFNLVINHHNDVNLLSFPGFNNIELEVYVTKDDLPSIVDVDHDGDIDILTFSVSGSKMEWYKNVSVEMGWGTDSLYFELEDQCWGLFIESGTSSDITLSDNMNQCADLNGFIDDSEMFTTNTSSSEAESNTGLHAGSTSVCWDSDGDGDMELILGDLTNDKLTYLNSTMDGNSAIPWLNSKDENFPSYNLPVSIPYFPSPFILDVNNDGKKDFIVAPNDDGATLNKNVAWYYRNVATTDSEHQFAFVQKDFLVEDAFDFGQGAKPVFFDYNADGLMDIVIGTDGYYLDQGTFDTRLVLLKNVGTTTHPAYQIEDEDWLGFSEYSERNLAPAFGDLDTDGDVDLLVGENSGSLFFVENTGGTGVPVFNQIIPNYLNIEAGQKCVPAIADLDQDGLADIVSGIKQGRLTFFKNIGSVGTPNFNPDRSAAPNIDGLGSVDVRYNNNGVVDTRGYAAPKVFYLNGTTPHIISGSYFNNIFVYNTITNDLTTPFVLTDDHYGEIYEGQQTALDVADIDNDGYFEIVIGNYRGGISFYETNLQADNDVANQNLMTDKTQFNITPNPALDYLDINLVHQTNSTPVEIHMGLMDVKGRWLKKISKTKRLNIANLAAGIYILVVDLNGEKFYEKIVKQ